MYVPFPRRFTGIACSVQRGCSWRHSVGHDLRHETGAAPHLLRPVYVPLQVRGLIYVHRNASLFCPPVLQVVQSSPVFEKNVEH